jgi:hypothetical protein
MPGNMKISFKGFSDGRPQIIFQVSLFIPPLQADIGSLKLL